MFSIPKSNNDKKKKVDKSCFSFEQEGLLMEEQQLYELLQGCSNWNISQAETAARKRRIKVALRILGYMVRYRQCNTPNNVCVCWGYEERNFL